jgi:ABC-type nitrate/sulfonate/bicarbonate transport system substrate-binding protein
VSPVTGLLTRRQAAAVLLAASAVPAAAADLAGVTLRVGDQKGGSRSLMEAAGVLDGTPYPIEWREFPAAAPLLEALNAGAIDTGVAGDAPVIFAQAAGVPLKIIGAWRYDPVGTAIVAPGASRRSSPWPTSRASGSRPARARSGTTWRSRSSSAPA